MKVAYHTDGCVYAIIPELIEIGIDVLNPVQPAAMDPVLVKREYGNDLCFWGSMDEQHTLPFGSPDDVRQEVVDRIATLGAGGGLILAPTHHVQLDTPLENFWAMVEAVTGNACVRPVAVLVHAPETPETHKPTATKSNSSGRLIHAASGSCGALGGFLKRPGWAR